MLKAQGLKKDLYLSIGLVVEETAAAHPDAIAIKYQDRRLTWAEFNQLSNRYAAVLADKGVKSGDRVAINMENRAETLAVVLARQIPTVLDADALTLIARHPDLFDRLHAGCVLTPHGGEFARVFPDIAASLHAPVDVGPAFSRVDAARQAAKRAGCTVLIKGPDTVIAAPSGKTHVNGASYDRAAPWLATAGSGDVLAGIITGLLARGIAPFEAATHGAWLHAACARAFGPGMIAEDLPEQLPQVFRDLGL